MRLIAANNLKAGDRLGKTIFTGEGNILLAKGVRLTDYFIHKLKELDLNIFYIEDEHFEDVEPEEALSERVKMEVTQKIVELHSSIRTSTKRPRVDERLIKQSAADIVADILNKKNTVHSLIEMRSKEEWLVSHSIQVSVIAVILGQALGLNMAQLEELAIGGLLHDIGLSFLPPEYLTKPPTKYTAEETKLYQTHTTEGFNFLRKKLEVGLLAAHVAFQHHELLGGGGFPRGLKGDEITLYAKIVRVADLYDELASGVFGSSPILPHEAYEIILGLAGRTVEFDIVEVFTQHIAAYPTGCSVLLSNGQTGIITGQNSIPTRPNVRVLWNKGGEISIVEYDLCKELTLFVKEIIL